MPQGKLKTKVQLPKGVKQKQKSQKKATLRKGHMTIGSKKSKLVEAARLKKNMGKVLKASIEEEALSLAAHSEPRALSLLKSKTASKPQPSGSSKKKK